VIPLLQMKTADTAHTGIFASVPRLLSQSVLGGTWGQGKHTVQPNWVLLTLSTSHFAYSHFAYLSA